MLRSRVENMKRKKIEFNPQFKAALDMLQFTDRNIFVTGKAGTGKTTLLDYFRSNTKKKVVALAPTGVAALNVNGQTIHSFFRFGTDVTYEKIRSKFPGELSRLIRELDVLIVDEVSMVRADLLDCMDKAMRLCAKCHRPFGGKQVAFFGDLYQLPPVVKSSERRAFTDKYETSYFYSANVMKEIRLELVELETIYRQHDSRCIDILNGIRNNTIGDDLMAELNRRVDPDFVPPPDDFYVTLTSRNAAARAINESFLNTLPGPGFPFEAAMKGDINPNDLPADKTLIVKKGAQVMFLNNDVDGEWVNGTMGVVTGVKPDSETILVKTMSGQTVGVAPYKWKLSRYLYDAASKSIQTETIGSFEQFPVRLAWALTIHKSQGKTFPKLIVDTSGAFAAGQAYVALSRCTGLDGLVLKRRIEKKHVLTDWRVPKFLTGFQYARSEERMSKERKVELIKSVIQKRGLLEIVYLKAADVKSRRTIEPRRVGHLLYNGRTFLGVEAYCHERSDIRNFRVDRILEMKEIAHA